MKLKFKILFFSILLLWLWFYFSLPDPLFDNDYSTVVFSADSILIGAHVAGDGQWRFKHSGNVPAKYKECLLAFEDKRFYRHPGVDIVSLGRAVVQNIRRGRKVSGASTITMQLARLSKGNPPRTIYNKIKEIFLALRLDLQYDKDSILSLYAANAPFGGNVVGLDAAAWRYFGLPPSQLSWAQAATLAVLPNSPALIHPGANRHLLRKKRDWLLKKLHHKGIIDSTVYRLALKESIPGKPLPVPSLVPHLVSRFYSRHGGGSYYTMIDMDLQRQLRAVMKYHQAMLKQNGIYNMAIIVVRNTGGAVMAYLGNTEETGNRHNNYVDMIMAGRSGGSILKPLLYASAMEEGTITPYQLLPDVPVSVSGYQPRNFSGDYDGVVRVEEALKRSLNIPAVLVLQHYGIQKMIGRFRDFGLTTVSKPAEYYGLPLILGAPDVRLWELAGVYASMARTLNDYVDNDSRYFKNDFFMPVLEKNHLNRDERVKVEEAPVIGAAPVWFVFEFLSKPERPGEDGQWEKFVSQTKIAWKTGTSFGFRDAWAAGVSKDYTAVVWVGNSSGEGRPGLTGIKAAAPVLFDVFDKLPVSEWFDTPYDDMRMVEICRHSGFLKSDMCEYGDTLPVPSTAVYERLCPYHKVILTTSGGKMIVPPGCSGQVATQVKKCFVLPPKEEFYYRRKHPEYKGLPGKKYSCQGESSTDEDAMQFIYPNKKTKVIIPVDFDGKKGRIVLKIAHRNPDATIFWHIDKRYIASTKEFHNIEVFLTPGKHRIMAIDNKGNEVSAVIQVAGDNDNNR